MRQSRRWSQYRISGSESDDGSAMQIHFSFLFFLLLSCLRLRHKLFAQGVCVPGVLVCLLGKFVCCQVVFLTVCDGRGIVRVGCKVMKLRNSIVCALWHGWSPFRWMPG
jgi:hypothetical protein